MTQRQTYAGRKIIGWGVNKEEEKELFELIGEYTHTEEYGPRFQYEAAHDAIVAFVENLARNWHCPRCSCE
jgi:hypothetical protein